MKGSLNLPPGWTTERPPDREPRGGNPRRILFAGSRTYTDAFMVRVVVNGLAVTGAGNPLLFGHGHADGADQLVGRAAKAWPYIEVERWPAAWADCDHEHRAVPCPAGIQHRRTRRDGGSYCPVAGPRRNADMLAAHDWELLIAFADKPLVESTGTLDMVRRAKAAGIAHHTVTTTGRTL